VDPGFSFDAVVATGPNPSHDSTRDELLGNALDVAQRAHPSVVKRASAWWCDLSSGQVAQWDADADIYPASIVKVPIMAAVFARYARGTLRPDDPVTVDARNQTATSGPAPFITGYRTTVQELVDYMIAHSDNVATNQLIDLLGREQVTTLMRGLGMPSFVLGRKLSGSEPLIDDPEQVGRNRLTAQEIGTLLLAIARDLVPGAAEQRRILSTCVDAGKLVAGLRPGDRFAHKTGETSTVSHDAGILSTATGAHIIVLHTEVQPTPDHADATHANPFMAMWMRVLREAL
jgi:beta-lactamase class A